jgi:hypothetical protein
MNDEINTTGNRPVHHIIGPSSTLLGFSFLVLTSIKSLGLSTQGISDEIAGVCVILYSLSTVFSFASISSFKIGKKYINFEKIADITFLIALIFTVALSLLLVFDVVTLGK